MLYRSLRYNTVVCFETKLLFRLETTTEKDTVWSLYLEFDGTIFYKFKLPEVQINLHFG